MIETTCIIEHLQAHHPGPNVWIPDGELGRRVRFLDRFFDLHVQGNMQPAVNHALRPEGMGDAYGAEQGAKNLRIAYDWLEANLPDERAGRPATASRLPIAPRRQRSSTPTGSSEIGDERPTAESLSRPAARPPVVARAVDEARPYRPYFPLGAPDRD